MNLRSFDNSTSLNANIPKAWESGKWSVVSGAGVFDNDTLYRAVVSELSTGDNTLAWKISNRKCAASDEVKIRVEADFIPRAFSPNDDPEGYNNYFAISDLQLNRQEAELFVVDGAGSEVFSTTNRNGKKWVDWEGKDSKGRELPEGTYYYLLKVYTKSNGGQVIKRSGFVLLKR